MVIDEVFMGGRSAQERLAAAPSGVPVVWVGVQCDPGVAEARERARLDRCLGWPAFKPGGCMEVSSTTWSWAARRRTPPIARALLPLTSPSRTEGPRTAPA